jgi:hypothetical protein
LVNCTRRESSGDILAVGRSLARELLAAFLPEAAGAFPALSLAADGLLCDRVMLQQMDPQSVNVWLTEHRHRQLCPAIR